MKELTRVYQEAVMAPEPGPEKPRRMRPLLRAHERSQEWTVANQEGGYEETKGESGGQQWKWTLMEEDRAPLNADEEFLLQSAVSIILINH